MKVSIILVNFNGTKHTVACVASIRAHAPSFPYEVIVVDNGSSDAEKESLKRQLPDCTVVQNDKNIGFGGANNIGAARAKGELLFFLNNDTIVTSDVVTPLAEAMDRSPGMGLVGPALCNVDGTFQVSFGRFPSLVKEWQTRSFGNRFNRLDPGNVGVVEESVREWITGAAMLVRKKCFDQLGGFDESYFMYFEDVDLCYRARRLGFEIGYLADFSIIHLGGTSYVSGDSGIRREYRRSQLRFYDKFQSLPERFMLRVYLLLKAFAMLFTDARTSAAIAGLVFRFHGSTKA